MANTLKHKFVSAKADDPDATLVQASDWNSEHAFNGGSAGHVLTRNPLATDGASWVPPDALNLMDPQFGAVGNGVADDSNAIQAWIAAIPEDGWGFVPRGIYYHTEAIQVEKPINIRGVGPGSTFAANVGAAVDGWTIRGDLFTRVVAGVYSTTWEGLMFRPSHISVNPATGTVQDGLVIRNVHSSFFKNLFFSGQGRYGMYAQGCLEVDYDVNCSVNFIYPHYAFNGAPVSGLLRLRPQGVYACNAGHIVMHCSGGTWVAATSAALFIEDMGGGTDTGEGNLYVSGVIQGGTGYKVAVAGCKGLTFDNFHMEGGNLGIQLSKCRQTTFGPRFWAGGLDIQVGDCVGVQFINCYANIIDLVNTTAISNVVQVVNGGDSGNAHLAQEVRRNPTAITQAPMSNHHTHETMGVGHAPVQPTNVAINGDMRYWVGSTPVPYGYVNVGAITSHTQSGIGLGDTDHPWPVPYADLIVMGGDNAGLEQLIKNTAAASFEQAVAPSYFMTASCWVKIPTVGGTDTIILRLRSDPSGFVRDFDTDATVVTGEWVQLNVNKMMSTTGGETALRVDIVGGTAGNFYVTGLTVWPGFGKPYGYDPRPGECGEAVYFGGRKQEYAAAMPASGAYKIGNFVWNTAPAIDGSNMVLLGWSRLTNGSAHVAGTDWAICRVSTVSPAT